MEFCTARCLYKQPQGFSATWEHIEAEYLVLSSSLV